MPRHDARSPVSGRFQTVDPEKDLAPANISGADVYEVSDNAIDDPAAPAVTDEPEAEPAHFRRIAQATGLRDPYGRVDQHLVERAQAGADPLPGTPVVK